MNYIKKRMVSVLFCSVLLLAACGSKDENLSSDTDGLRKMSDAVIQKMQAITSDENYQTLIGSPDEVKQILKEWVKHSPDTSADILVIPVTEKLIPADENLTIDLDQLNDVAKEYGIRRIAATAICSQLNSTYAGTAAIAASSIAQYSETFRIEAGSFTDQVWIISCTDSLGILVSFVNTGDNVATVSASYCALPEPESRNTLLPLLFGASSYEEIGACVLPS